MHKTQSYAYSTDDDDHAKERSARSTKFFQGKTEMSHQETIEKIMYNDNEIEESREDSSSTSCEYDFNLYHLLLLLFKVIFKSDYFSSL